MPIEAYIGAIKVPQIVDVHSRMIGQLKKLKSGGAVSEETPRIWCAKYTKG